MYCANSVTYANGATYQEAHVSYAYGDNRLDPRVS
jgi:hypothetical protein